MVIFPIRNLPNLFSWIHGFRKISPVKDVLSEVTKPPRWSGRWPGQNEANSPSDMAWHAPRSLLNGPKFQWVSTWGYNSPLFWLEFWAPFVGGGKVVWQLVSWVLSLCDSQSSFWLLAMNLSASGTWWASKEKPSCNWAALLIPLVMLGGLFPTIFWGVGPFSGGENWRETCITLVIPETFDAMNGTLLAFSARKKTTKYYDILNHEISHTYI